jgi:ABC-type Fe3+/spermidine/putrescine transport system ATPase subunit
MSSLTVTEIHKSFGTTPVLKGVSLEVSEGEFVSVLGPSGCGKSTLLRIIAGFESVESGSVSVAGRDITRMPTRERGVGFVFQDYALWPHMTVLQHVEFGLKVKKTPSAEMARRVEEMLHVVNLAGMEGRYTRQLSGGQRQRVALARALAVQPSVLLLDEPLSNLDRNLREVMKIELKRLQRTLGFTVVFVTHDQEEALAMSNRVIVMDAGCVAQEGTPSAIYESPASEYVARFVGNANIFDGRVTALGQDHVHVELPGGTVLPTRRGSGAQPNIGDPVKVFSRPEDVELHLTGDGVAVRITEIIYEGAHTRAVLEIAGDPRLPCSARVPNAMAGHLSVGNPAVARFNPALIARAVT